MIERPSFLKDTLVVPEVELDSSGLAEVFTTNELYDKVLILLSRGDTEARIRALIDLKKDDIHAPKWAIEDRIRAAIIEALAEEFNEDIRPLLTKSIESDFEVHTSKHDITGEETIVGYEINNITCDPDKFIVKF